MPLIRTVDEVKQVVAAAKFPPKGRRGFGSPLPMQNFDPQPSFTEYLQHANDALLTMVQIETKEALDAVDEIAPLVDVLFIGPFDLGNNIGHPIIDGVVKPELKAAIAKILKAAHVHGKKCGMYAGGGEEAARYVSTSHSWPFLRTCATDCWHRYGKEGFDMINVGTDLTTLEHIMKQSMAVATDSAGPEKGKSYGA